MSSMTSRSLRWAREDRDKAGKAWRGHCKSCTRCLRAHRLRNNDRCDEGSILAAQARETVTRVRAEQQAAAQVPAGQAALF